LQGLQAAGIREAEVDQGAVDAGEALFGHLVRECKKGSSGVSVNPRDGRRRARMSLANSAAGRLNVGLAVAEHGAQDLSAAAGGGDQDFVVAFVVRDLADAIPGFGQPGEAGCRSSWRVAWAGPARSG
jgi:hypothetical protein